MASATILTPPGRIVRGSLYKGFDKDAEGRPLVVKTGPQQGQARLDYFFAIAIPKAGEQHWSQTAWGATIAKTGMESFPQAYASPTFAWKVVDGDSTIPNKKGKKPCDNEGYPGHWVVSFSSGFAPKVYTDGGERLLTEPDAVKPGFWVQVSGTVAGNGSTSQPGVFVNHNMVCFIKADKEIIQGPDATAVGFQRGGGMPPGVVPNAAVGAFAAPAMPGAPVFPGVGAPAAGFPAPAAAVPGFPAPGAFPAPAAAFPAPAVPPVAVAPNFAPLMPPGGVAPGFPAPPPAAPVRQMTALAQGASYEQLIANGWTDAVLIQHGLMLA